jgi:hypothetical protein
VFHVPIIPCMPELKHQERIQSRFSSIDQWLVNATAFCAWSLSFCRPVSSRPFILHSVLFCPLFSCKAPRNRVRVCPSLLRRLDVPPVCIISNVNEVTPPSVTSTNVILSKTSHIFSCWPAISSECSRTYSKSVTAARPTYPSLFKASLLFVCSFHGCSVQMLDQY